MTNPAQAALYLRSSKDRHDVSLDAQRRALHELAAERGLDVVTEYADAVESGADDQRPGFQGLLRDLKARDRPWSVLLVLDTSRIARRRHLALVAEHEAERAGVLIVYRSVPDTDPITGMLLRSVLQAMDEWHSLTSKAKGLAGQAENIRQGWRAGGRAPLGYALERVPTGAVREGEAVTKSRLIPGPQAETVATYLRARAAGKPRSLALSVAGAQWPQASLHDLERSALTYAGHTVWGRSGGHQRRLDRAAWTIQRDTHPALITEAEAEAVLAQLDRQRQRRTRTTARHYLLAGLLVHPDGRAWSGDWDSKTDAPMYRLGKGRRISGRHIEAAIVEAVFADLAAPETAERIATHMRAMTDAGGARDEQARLTREIDRLTRQVAKLVELIVDTEDPAPYRRAISERERERHTLLAQRNEAIRREAQAAQARRWTAADVQRLLTGLRADLEQRRSEGDVIGLRAALADLVERIEYDPDEGSGRIAYRLDTGITLASPRGGHGIPVRWSSKVQVGRR